MTPAGGKIGVAVSGPREAGAADVHLEQLMDRRGGAVVTDRSYRAQAARGYPRRLIIPVCRAGRCSFGCLSHWMDRQSGAGLLHLQGGELRGRRPPDGDTATNVAAVDCRTRIVMR